MKNKLYAAVELGGTKVNCIVAENVGTIVNRIQMPTKHPEETMKNIIEFFRPYLPIEALGVGSFGPVGLNSELPDYGCIQETPKKFWSNIKVLPIIEKALGCIVKIDTDVNAAGLAEHQLGAGRGLKNFVYTTVGTGIGSGIILNGMPLKGSPHPEVGHIELCRKEDDADYISCCPFHSNCAEGLASGSAIKKRWGVSLKGLNFDHPAWELEAKYLAKYAHALTLSYSPDKLIFGGGVSSEDLLVKVRDEYFLLINGYLNQFSNRESLNEYIVMPELGSEAGPIGSLLLAINHKNRIF